MPEGGRGLGPLWSFEQLAEKAFGLDPGVRWVAVARPGQAPRWTYRPGIRPLNADATDEAEERLVNPALLALAGARGDWDLDGLRFLVLAYGRLTQVVAGLHGGGHISVSLDLDVDAWQVGTKVARLAKAADG